MLLLASSSPRRSELLKMAGYDFNVVPADVNEGYLRGTPPIQIVELLAARKAEAVAKRYPQDIVLGADTIVVLKGRVLGKPKNEEEAKAMLKLLAGNVHQVYTGYCIINNKKYLRGHESTSVEFYPLKESEIDSYVASGEAMDKAGAYAIQGRGALFIKRIDGDYYNVMGLPIGKINRILAGIKSSGDGK
ncbi:septum formation inhibitor Maf [Caproiciproducens galactitolivorans]|uniref:dTTP/UTP pyrophosphatase n=1 Tax=Caproiciproducens galactitolivorans TaxID=642589 RepID=A0A4Z0YDV3_9FIRM|nr:Maf family protein [Caproiciproducens galactitolivorans]QEY35305.1 septum formation inhibitor Maf [Caproiciproducens galactitolivorans]TGJ77003.1 septum formation protein Maf [Caproiciproducens galactitolivorans]